MKSETGMERDDDHVQRLTPHATGNAEPQEQWEEIASDQAEKAARQLLNEDQWHEGTVVGIAGELEPFIIEALRQQHLPLIEGYIRMFVEAILHGDDDHRMWLKEAGEAFINGTPMPKRLLRGDNKATIMSELEALPR